MEQNYLSETMILSPRSPYQATLKTYRLRMFSRVILHNTRTLFFSSSKRLCYLDVSLITTSAAIYVPRRRPARTRTPSSSTALKSWTSLCARISSKACPKFLRTTRASQMRLRAALWILICIWCTLSLTQRRSHFTIRISTLLIRNARRRPVA